MKIRLTTELSSIIRFEVPKPPQIKVVSAKDNRLTFESSIILSRNVVAELGNVAKVILENETLGITGTRPLIGIRRNREKSEFSGFCFRNCLRLYIYDVYGGLPRLRDFYSQNTLAHFVPLGFLNHLDEGIWGDIDNPGSRNRGRDDEYLFHLYSQQSFDPDGPINGCFRKFIGYLDDPVTGIGSSFKLYPIWKFAPPYFSFREVSGKKLHLVGLIYATDFVKHIENIFRL